MVGAYPAMVKKRCGASVMPFRATANVQFSGTNLNRLVDRREARCVALDIERDRRPVLVSSKRRRERYVPPAIGEVEVHGRLQSFALFGYLVGFTASDAFFIVQANTPCSNGVSRWISRLRRMRATLRLQRRQSTVGAWRFLAAIKSLILVAQMVYTSTTRELVIAP